MKAVGNKILLQVTKKCDGTSMQKIGDLLMAPMDPKMAFWEATIVSVGAEVKEVKDGDTILIYPEVGKEIFYDGQVYRLISTSEIIAVI